MSADEQTGPDNRADEPEAATAEPPSAPRPEDLDALPEAPSWGSASSPESGTDATPPTTTPPETPTAPRAWAEVDRAEAPTRPDIIPGAARSGSDDILPAAPPGMANPGAAARPFGPPPVASVRSVDDHWSPSPTLQEPWHAQIDQLRYEIRRVIVGQHRVVERVLVALLAGGHCLLEGAPGLGKTKLLSTLSRCIGGSFSRIQFTPDLIPADIVGTRIYRASSESFDVELGPIFANLVLADEINRAPAKVQSALLEVMAEHQVTIGGSTHPVPDPFLVLATQNPIEHEGVYALPEAQRDRFLMRIPVDYPTPGDEAEIVRRGAVGEAVPDTILSTDDVIALQRRAKEVHVDPRVADYAVRLVLATRSPSQHELPELEGLIEYGASPRATLGLLSGGRALAVVRGRRWVSPQEVFDVAYDVLNHRLVLAFDALADGTTVDEVLVTLLSTVRAPVGVTEPRDVA